MSDYRIWMVKDGDCFAYKFSGKIYSVDDHTGTLIDDRGDRARLSYLENMSNTYRVVPSNEVVSDGGPSTYYDLPKDLTTLNDILEFKGEQCWGADSFHLANIVKATWRWGTKAGTSKPYDTKKILYSAARLLMKYSGVTELRKSLQQMLDDPQFQERTEK